MNAENSPRMVPGLNGRGVRVILLPLHIFRKKAPVNLSGFTGASPLISENRDHAFSFRALSRNMARKARPVTIQEAM